MVDYKSRKNDVLDSSNKLEELVAELKAHADSIGMPNPLEKVDALLTDIRGKAARVKEDRFSLMVAGESKSGKSTFINAYLGVELLPMDVKQCTSSIVEIKYGEAFLVRATYADGRKREIKGDEAARDFLKKNASLDDEYRDIPVPTINSEIIVKAGRKAKSKGGQINISDTEIKALLAASEVKAANIHSLPSETYEKKIREYIDETCHNTYNCQTLLKRDFRNRVGAVKGR